VAVSPGRGRATWTVEDFQINDYGTLANALSHGEAIGVGVLNMMMTWSGGGEVTHISDPANGFTGRLVTGTSHISWTVEMNGFSFTADESGQTSLVSQVWKERNGVFFPA
jgi:hypothetical protein